MKKLTPTTIHISRHTREIAESDREIQRLREDLEVYEQTLNDLDRVLGVPRASSSSLCAGLMDRAKQVMRDNQRLREALAVYADRDNWGETFVPIGYIHSRRVWEFDANLTEPWKPAADALEPKP